MYKQLMKAALCATVLLAPQTRTETSSYLDAIDASVDVTYTRGWLPSPSDGPTLVDGEFNVFVHTNGGSSTEYVRIDLKRAVPIVSIYAVNLA